MKDKIEVGLLNEFVEQLDSALRSFLADPSNIDISDEDTDVQRVNPLISDTAPLIRLIA